MSGDDTPYTSLGREVEELFEAYENGHLTSRDREVVDSAVRDLRRSLLYQRLHLSSEDQERHEPERWSLLRKLLVIDLFLHYVASPYTGIQAEVKDLFVKADDKNYREQNRDSIQEEIRRLRCDLLAKMHALSKEEQAKHKAERAHLCDCLAKIEFILQGME